MRIKYKQSGFTIVELLIVIIVIGILAVIAIVAFNGIQQRASNTQRTSAAKEWQKLIGAYITQNSAYPYNGSGHFCLGSGYATDWDANPDEDCLYISSVKHPSAALNTALSTIGASPNFPTKPITTNGTAGGIVSGISMRRTDTVDGIVNYGYLWFWLEGTNQDCVLRPLIKIVSSTYTIDPNAINTRNEGSATECRIALPNPATL